MRYTIALAALAFLTAAPLSAQQETGQQKTSSPTTSEQTPEDQVSDADDDLDARIESDWSKIQSHWKVVESADASDKAELLETHRAQLGEFMKELDEHAQIEIGMEHPDEETEAMEASLAKAQSHWEMVQGIKDPEQLETHLGMHMEILAPLVAEEDDYGDTGVSGKGMGHGDMDHGDMDHGDMDHGDMDHGDMDHGAAGGYQPESPRPEPEKPAGY